MFFIHQCVDLINFQKIENATTSKECWDILEKGHAAYERVNERSKDRGIDQALQAQTFKKNGGNKWKGKNKYKNGNSQSDSSKKEQDKGESSKNGSNNKGKKKMNKKNIQCYNCQKYGHFASECRGQKVPRQYNNEESKANMAKNDSGSEQDEDPLLMMATTNDDLDKQEGWNLDTCCSNHMTGHKDWLVNYDSSRKSTIRFADSRTIKSEGNGDVLIKGKNGDQALITGVLYVPNMQSNLLSMGQLVEKGFTMTLGNNQVKVYNVENKLKIK
ncbi:unnamed protein product [Trifolium pratense]|uniref:Uncharacterized protein n=1 Tax=Trifolium pratense TaxID=57577 RepID=A0ACB0J0E4_TRIPR|nr:unnamed protein product [Trifolium pratense]